MKKRALCPLSGVHLTIKPQVHAIRIMLSASPEAMERIEQEGRLDDWCEQSVEWMQETFGTENLVSAVLHLDEKTPHIHATVVPIVTATRRKKKSEENVKKHYREKADGARLCADDIMTQAKLKNYQTSYATAMHSFGLERGTDGSEARHISTREYWKSHTNLTHPGKYFRPSKVKIMRPTSPK